VTGEPVSHAAEWSRRLAVFAAFVAGVAVLLARVHAADAAAALTVFAAALIIAGLAFLLSAAAASVIWRDGVRGAGPAFLGFCLSTGLMAYPAYLGALAFALPKINDVSTDPAAPPAFLGAARARTAGGGAEPSPASDAARAQARSAYPDAEPIKVQMDVLAAYRLALSVATDFGWRIVDLVPPGPQGGTATIEAIDRSLFFGFPSDVVIRVRPGATSTTIDVRSVSRPGLHDFGAGAARIRKFAEAIRDAPVER